MANQKIRREYMIYPKCFKRWNGLFYKALITKDFVFYTNYHEGDDNANVEMYRRLGGANLELISNNYFANVGLLEELEKKNWGYISKTMSTNYKLMQEQHES
jgi:hypothetical protein